MELKRILIVDDAPPRREVLLRLLQEKQYEVLEAATCEEALDVLRTEHVFLVLTETELPTKSGLFLLKTVKDSYPDIEVILITHNASSYNLLQALRLGAYDFIVRPIDTGEILYNAVDRAFGHMQLRTQNARLLKESENHNRFLRRSLKMMKALNLSTERLAAAMGIEELLMELLDSAMKEIQAKRGFLALFDKTSGELGLKAGEGIPTELCRLYASRIPAGLTTEIARRGKPLLVAGELPPKIAALATVAERENLLAAPGLLAAPLRLKERSIGVVILSGHPDACCFGEHDLHFLIQLSQHAALALEKTGIIHQLRRGKTLPPTNPGRKF
ncbi:MAG: hypothetical protein A2091_03300 [Desulfuromonadales bacterium GWD2_61_12]|nr:MAG: hypothetical protein A2005_06380 [Desulfuromonadales bacterium GWC2_61_20]OGR34929.1 MAG: hypothetical protein A2091_03300 [Desulfuromonadales bacterium GWD2_61_12]